MDFFKKKKKQPDAGEEALIEKLTADPNEPKATDNSLKGASEARIEKMDAQITAIREVLQAQQERFERQTEQIGELRSMLAEREKHIRDLEAKALRASELVAEIQPENLLSDQKKMDAKIEALRGKIENGELMSNRIIEEFKKIKNSISVFRGTEDVLKLNKEARDEIIAIKRVEATTGKHADRVEAIYTNFESKFQEFEKLKDDLKGFTDAFESLRKDVEKNRAAIVDLPKKEEFYQSKKDVQGMLDTIKNEKESYDQRRAAAEASMEEFARNIRTLQKRMDSITGVIERLARLNIMKRL